MNDNDLLAKLESQLSERRKTLLNLRAKPASTPSEIAAYQHSVTNAERAVAKQKAWMAFKAAAQDAPQALRQGGISLTEAPPGSGNWAAADDKGFVVGTVTKELRVFINPKFFKKP